MQTTNKKGQQINVIVGQFPTLISDDKKVNGMIMANRTRALPKSVRSNEKFGKTQEEKKELKSLRRVATFSNTIIKKN